MIYSAVAVGLTDVESATGASSMLRVESVDTVLSAGATESTGSAVVMFTILLAANTLLTETIATAAITAKTNFFIIYLTESHVID